MEIGWIEVLKKRYGETAYARMAQSILSEHHHLEILNVGVDHFKKYDYPVILFRLSRLKGAKDIWIRNFDSVITLPFDYIEGKNLVLIHHIDFSTQPSSLRLLFKGLEKGFYRHLRRVDSIVTVSKYWQNHFLDRGHQKVFLIYNGFNLDLFHFEDEEVSEFRKRFHLEEKPIIYIGNCQRIKGVVEAYEQLKDLKVYLVTSGGREVHLPIPNLNLSDREYLLLLKSSSVVITMSKFKEGWGRTAHEAMLCKTPVIGSGLGGMRELLEGGGQIICEDFKELKEKVHYALDHPEQGQRGYEFARQFTTERFEADWLDLIGRIGENR
jgi:glycosyltransferase involved in cell wall biosynthesis